MHIVYFYQYFSTPNGSWGTRVYEFAKRWIAQGHKVTVVTSIYDKSDLTSKGISTRENFDGVEVIILNLTISNKQPILKRIWTFVAYAILSSYYALRLKADVVISSSGPITAGIPGLIAHSLKRKKIVFEVRDLWPEGAIEMGLLNNKRAQNIAFWLAKKCYNSAKAVVSLSPGMKDYIEKNYRKDEIYSVPNASDIALFSKDTSDFQLPDWAINKRIYLYTGNIGKVNNSYMIIKAAAQLQHHANAIFVFIGEGQQKTELKQYIVDNNINNVKFLDLMPKSQLVGWVQRAYYMLVPLEAKPILDTSSPNKLFDALAAGTPVIQTTMGWIKEFLDEFDSGFTVDAANPSSLVELVNKINDDTETQKRMGLNAKKVALERFDRDILSNQMLEVLTKVHQNK